MEGKGYNYQPDQTQASRAPVAAAPANTTIIAKLVQNNAWMKDPKYVKEQDRFMAIGDQLHAEDPSLKGAEFLAVLGGRFNREYPGLFKGIDGTVPASVVTSVSPPVHRGSKLLQEWLNANPWYTDVKYAKQAARIKQIDNELSAENPNLNIDKCG